MQGMRGLQADAERGWRLRIYKEDKSKLEWFQKNERRLEEIANQPRTKVVTQGQKDAYIEEMVESFKQHTRFPRKIPEEPAPINPRALKDLMYPIDPEIRNLVNVKGGRKRYLQERSTLPVDKRYYLPETSNFIYGWNMGDYKAPKYGFGRCHIIKHTFYRRQGVHQDPDWYREPAVYNTSICNAS